MWVDSHGALAPTAVAPNLFGTLNLSPDGQRVVAEVGGIQNDIYVYDLRDGRGIRITRDGSGGARPLWHPDGRRIVFYSEAENRYVIKPVESGAGPQGVTRPDWQITSWAESGVIAGVHERRIWVGSTTNQTSITSTAKEWGAVVSPDGKRVAYTSARTGTYQVFAQPNPPTGQEWQISAEFGEEPVWSRRSPELFYRRHDQWWSVSFAGGVPASPRLLFQGPFFNAFGPSYDIGPDGRFLMALPPPGSDSTRELLWIDGWASDLKSRARSERQADLLPFETSL